MTVLDMSLDQFKAWVHTTISNDDGINLQALQASTAYLAHRTGRNLTLVTSSTTATAMSMRPVNSCTDLLYIQDAASITSVVEAGATLVAGTDYIAEPYGNVDEATGDWMPYDRLYRINTYWYSDGRTRPIVVTAKWGWSTVHPLAREAVKVLAADWLSLRESRNGIVSATVDGFSIGARSNPLVEQAVSALAGPQSFGIA